MKEIWKKIEGYPAYEVSNLGKVRSWYNNKWGKAEKPKLLKPPSKDDRPKVVLVFAGRKKNMRIHKLVLNAFGPKRPTPKHECCHNDGNVCNNHISNLRWGTSKENAADMVKHGRSLYGSRNFNAKLTEKDIPEILKMKKDGALTSEIAQKFGMTFVSIWKIIKRETWKHVSV